MENLRERIDVMKKTIWNRRQNQARCHTKIFGNDLVAIRKSKVTLTLNKTACVAMCIVNLSKLWYVNLLWLHYK